jgi:hypothetical protein
MKAIYLVTAAVVATTIAYAAPVRDWHELGAVHDHIMRSIGEME